MTNSSGVPTRPGDRPLTLLGSVSIGLVSMVGAGLFTVFAPAAAAAGRWLLLALVISALVVSASAHSMVRLAARHPGPGGVYVYGRERLGLPWGHLAGWSFVGSTSAACAVMAMTIGVHLWPDHAKLVAVVAVLASLVLNLQGVRRSERTARVLLIAVLVLTLTFAIVMLAAPPVTIDAPPPAPPGSGGALEVLQAAGLLFFAFAGFARVAPLGDAVEDPRRTIPRAVWVGLAIVFALYLFVALALKQSLGAGWVGAREAPLAEAAEISSWPWLGPVLRIAAVLVAGGALLTLTAGTSRIVVAMARDHHLPIALSVLDGARRTPRRAEAVVAAAVIVIIVLVDLREAIGFASFLALAYYAIANACAWTLDQPPVHKAVATFGLFACVVVAMLLPWVSVAAGLVTLALGAFIGWARWTTRDDRPT